MEPKLDQKYDLDQDRECLLYFMCRKVFFILILYHIFLVCQVIRQLLKDLPHPTSQQEQDIQPGL